jgi:acyl-homoserine lactone acylase PvdQ
VALGPGRGRSLGYGYGYALASDNLCTMANDYLTVEGQRSRYLGASATYPSAGGGPDVVNLDSDVFWQSVNDRRVSPGLLAARTGPAAISPQLRQLVAGYAAGYHRYLASVGGASGVPDPTCKGQAWVKPITDLDAWLRIYQVADLNGQSARAPYDVALGTLQFVVRTGQRIPLPGGPGDPDGDFNAIHSGIAGHPGADPSMGSSYLQVVTWPSGSRCPAASTLVTYSESASPASPHDADQTRLFAQRKWAAGYFCPAPGGRHALSTTVLRSR